MSIALRQATQPLLDSIGLEQFHIEISSGTKYLQIVGECGKPLTTITGIRYSKSDPTKKEIDYSLTLLSTYLTKNKDLLLKVYEAKKELSLAKLIDVKDYGPDISSYNQPYGNSITMGVQKLCADGKYIFCNVRVPVSLDVGNISVIGSSTNLTLNDMTCLLTDVNETFKYELLLAKDILAYQELVAKASKLQTSLNSCGI